MQYLIDSLRNRSIAFVAIALVALQFSHSACPWRHGDKELALSSDAGGDYGQVVDACRGGHVHEGAPREELRAANRLHCAVAQVLRTPLELSC